MKHMLHIYAAGDDMRGGMHNDIYDDMHEETRDETRPDAERIRDDKKQSDTMTGDETQGD